MSVWPPVPPAGAGVEAGGAPAAGAFAAVLPAGSELDEAQLVTHAARAAATNTNIAHTLNLFMALVSQSFATFDSSKRRDEGELRRQL